MTQTNNRDIEISKAEDDEPTQWWKLMGYGGLTAALTVVLYIYISNKESAGGTIRLWWLLAIAYKAVGKWGTVAIPGVIALILIGVGLLQLMSDRKKADHGTA